MGRSICIPVKAEPTWTHSEFAPQVNFSFGNDVIISCWLSSSATSNISEVSSRKKGHQGPGSVFTMEQISSIPAVCLLRRDNEFKVLKIWLKGFQTVNCSVLYLHHHFHPLWLVMQNLTVSGCYVDSVLFGSQLHSKKECLCTILY
jgi:hypothetical protein